MMTKTKTFAFSLLLAGACASAPPPRPAVPAATTAGLQIKLTTVYVDDQDKARRFYTDVLGFATKDDETNGPYRWLTVASPGAEDGAALLLALDNDPAAKAYKQSLFAQSQPAVMFFTDDIMGDYARIKARGASFIMSPTEVYPGSTIARLEDTCGNLIQITQVEH